jgi:fatty acid desaturase
MAERPIPNYRREIRKALPDELFKPEYGSLLWLPFHLTVIGLCLWGIVAYPTWFALPVFSLLIGHSFACMGFLAHDVAHGGAVKTIWMRDVIAGIGFSPIGIGPYLWRRWHNAEHHNNTQIEGVDPDHLFTIEDYQQNPILKWLYRIPPLMRNLIVFGSFSFRMTQQTIRMMITYLRSPKSTAMNKFTIIWQFTAQVGFWMLLTGFLGWKVLLFGYLIPVVIENAIIISYIATNHFLNPLADESDVLGTSLSVTLPKWLDWLDAMHMRFGAHVAHHLFPQASPMQSRKIEEKVAEMYPDRFHQMPIHLALKKLWDTPWVYEDHHTLIDPHRDVRSGTLGYGLDNPTKPRRSANREVKDRAKAIRKQNRRMKRDARRQAKLKQTVSK